MIIYDLVCPKGHQFEGWFPNLEEFNTQRKEGLVDCPVCGDVHVEKIPSGGHLMQVAPSPKAKAPTVSKQENATKQENTAAIGQLDPVTLVKAVRHYVKTHFENVGEQFAAKALQMHKGEIPPREIYGQADKQELKELSKEEVPHFLLPNLPPEYDN